MDGGFPPEVSELADAVEARLENGQEVTLPQDFQFESIRNQWAKLIESLKLSDV